MKLKRILTFLFVLTGSLFSISCEKNATIPLPKVEKKLVLTCFISPDEDSLTARVTWSKPIFGVNNNFIETVTDATVEITGPDGSAGFYLEPVSESYVVHKELIQIKPGATYTVSAHLPNGIMVRGTCTIPLRSENSFETEVLDSVLQYQDGNGKDVYSYNVKMKFKPSATGESWYRLGAYQRLFQDYFPDKPAQETWETLDYDLDSRFFVSSGPSANPYSAVVSTGAGFYNELDSSKVYRFMLVQGDRSYYQFHESVFNFEGDNPFAEPVQLFSNVEGGLGVVCSYLKESRTIRKP
ncbi:MAG TPA: DUF4249 domain-containing protein [Catalimonadaceae bacterium]|nr:DUF4249 domain-containing protein [Catalimonadaceae bacterium]